MPSPTLVSHGFNTPRHGTHFLEAGPPDGPLMIFLHGWPEIGLVWRAQMQAFAAEGWRCVAPDLRGYGGSSAPRSNDAYAIEDVVADMVELHDHLGGQPAIWVGHDWGSPVVSALAAHEPLRCRGIVLVSLPYLPDAFALPALAPLVDRTLYPADLYPDGQWDYYRYYTTHFDSAVADLDADPRATLASVYRSGNPDAMGKVSPSATVSRNGGRYGSAHRAPPTTPDPALWPSADFEVLVQAFETQGFRPASAWYLNGVANAAFARSAPRHGRLSQPLLYVNGDRDVICTIQGNRLGEPMREACADLSVTSLPAGHWLPLERKAELVRAIQDWLHEKGL
jgi:pimeloyl-ACP methyl ester carboxylesterase